MNNRNRFSAEGAKGDSRNGGDTPRSGGDPERGVARRSCADPASEADAGQLSRRERERLRCREEILDAAEELFAHHGFERTGVKQIAEQAELSVGQIYNHFEGKEEIFRELMERHLRELHDRINTAGETDDPPLVRIRCQLEAAIEHFNEHRDFLIIYHNENQLALEGLIKEEIRRNREIVAGLFAEAMERGDIPREDPYVLAAVLIGAAHRLLDMLMERDDGGAFDAVAGILERMIIEPLEMRQGQESHTEED